MEVILGGGRCTYHGTSQGEKQAFFTPFGPVINCGGVVN